MGAQGKKILLVLHAHLPFVRHVEENVYEENWLHEAVLECYLPLVLMLEGLAERGKKFRLTLSLSPTLMEMLADPLLKARTLRHMHTLAELLEKEVRRTAKDAALNPLAKFYLGRTRRMMSVYENARGGLLPRIAALREHVEVITTAATHAYLPNLAPVPEAVNAQIRAGIGNYKKHFPGRDPKGFWLPECGYCEGLDAVLKSNGVEYFFLNTSGVPRENIYRPLRCASGAVAFARDPLSAREVWCGQTGYPADPLYRDFYRDVGYELPMEYLHPHVTGFRVPTGIKYCRITGQNIGDKKIYIRQEALRRAREHALDFLKRKTEFFSPEKNPVLCAPFDAELFGHWWFEGIDWLGFLFEGAAGGVEFAFPSECLDGCGENSLFVPGLSSWGAGGYSDTWLNEKNGWAAAEACRAAFRMRDFFMAMGGGPADMERLRKQALRELLLVQASDWPFLIQNGSAGHYPAKRLRKHLERFYRLFEMAGTGRIDGAEMDAIEREDAIFPEMDCGVFS
ncbi:MAG: DUF1957 domain-containing protein [Nitrospiraceae bacterium]|nr:DUF1957 domain-containing protein [Nitrospiraceae bacterium]